MPQPSPQSTAADVFTAPGQALSQQHRLPQSWRRGVLSLGLALLLLLPFLGPSAPVLAEFSGVDYTLTNQNERDFSGQDLANTSFAGAQGRRARFQGTNLRGAILTQGAFPEADFRGADLSDAVLDRALLDGADLKGARINCTTRFPEGFDKGRAGLALIEKCPAP